MTKTIHHIATPNSGILENLCIDSWKKVYPDFEIKEWTIPRIDSGFPFEVMRILYENGGMFIWNNVQALKRLPDSLLESKRFVAYDSGLGRSDIVRPDILCSADKGDPILKMAIDERNANLLNSDETPYLNPNEYGMHDYLSHEIHSDGYFLNTCPRFDRIVDNVKLTYTMVNENSDNNKLFNLVNGFVNMKTDERRFLLIVCSSLEKADETSRMGTFLTYHLNERLAGNKMWDIIPCIGADDSIVAELMARRFNGVTSCEKVIL